MTFPNPNPETSLPAYVHMVQNLIEQCLVFSMTREECMAVLAEHADVKPVITSTVWDELEKTNREFFVVYNERICGNLQHSKDGAQSVKLDFGDENTENHR